jgi:uncharacterized protein (TIGR03083 family)
MADPVEERGLAFTLAALSTESEQAEAAMRSLVDADLARPTRCEAWDVRALIGHLIRDVDRIVTYLAASPPDQAPSPSDIDAVAYFHAFDPARAAPGVAQRSRETAAAYATREALMEAFAQMWRHAVEAATAAGPERVVTVAGGQTLRLADYVPTRVLEMTVHGLDLADAMGMAPWTTPGAAEVTRDLLVGLLERHPPAAWDDTMFFDKGTGRAPLSESDREELGAAADRFPLLA